MQFPAGHYVFLDLETTGGRASQDRITEVGLIEVLDGEVLDEYQSLINPEAPISRFITSLTGIDDGMVATAPTFGEIAEDLLAKLANKVLVAHNARFDHSFLKNEFRRAGYDYRTRVLCTVKMSRALMPQLSSHRLDNLIHVHGLWVENRHRAMGDTDLLVQLMSRWANTFGADTVESVIQQQLRTASLPPQLSRKMVDTLPKGPGVYLFYDHNDTLLYVGKSVNVRERVKSHFANDHASDKELAIAQQVHRIDYQLTAGDLGAQLLEMRLIKERQPIYNNQLRKTKLLWYFLLKPEQHGYLSLQLKSGNNLSLDDLPNVIGLFRSKKMAESVLQRAVKDNQLCHRLTGLEKGRKGACFAHQLQQCLGACAGKETAESYNQRLRETFAPWLFKIWPYPDAMVFEETHPADATTKATTKITTKATTSATTRAATIRPEETLTEYHLIDRWCHLKSSNYLSDLITVDTALRFEYDTYKLLTKWLAQANGKLYPLSEMISRPISA
jgi:DNA polymerase-3 subunit epsilon